MGRDELATANYRSFRQIKMKFLFRRGRLELTGKNSD